MAISARSPIFSNLCMQQEIVAGQPKARALEVDFHVRRAKRFSGSARVDIYDGLAIDLFPSHLPSRERGPGQLLLVERQASLERGKVNDVMVLVRSASARKIENGIVRGWCGIGGREILERVLPIHA